MKVQLPDGKVAEFPDDMPPAQVEDIIRQQFPATSAITGQPEQTSETRMAQTMDFLKEKLPEFAATAAPIAGDIAGMLVAPQFKAPQMAARIPGLMMRGANVALRMGGATTGGGLGYRAGQEMKGEPVDPEAERSQALWSGAGQGAFDTLGSAVNAIKRPALSLFSGLGMTGAFVKQKFKHGMFNRAQRFLSDLAPAGVKGEKGFVDYDNLKILMGEAEDESGILYDKVRDALADIARKEGSIPLDNTVQRLADIAESMPQKTDAAKLNAMVREFGFTASSPEGRLLKRLVESGQVTADEAHYLTSRAFKKFQKENPATQKLKEELKTNILQDYQTWGNKYGIPIDGMRREADEAFKQLKRFEAIQKVYQRGIKESGGKIEVNPKELAMSIYGSKTRLQKALHEDFDSVWPKLKAEADHYFSIAPQFETPLIMSASSLPLLYFAPGKGAALELLSASSAYMLMGNRGRKIIEGLIKGGSKVGEATLATMGSQTLGPIDQLFKAH